MPARQHVPARLRRGARAALRSSRRRYRRGCGNLAAVTERMDATLRGHGYAKSALRRRVLGRPGAATGQSVATLLGGALPGVPLYVAVPLGPAEAMAAFVERERAGGIHHFQLKLGAAPEEDLERVAAVHAVTGPEDALIGDANGAWRRQDAIIAAVFRRASTDSGSSSRARRSRNASRSAA